MKETKTASQFLVYGLLDPITGCLRYIGKSTSGFFRPTQHFYRSNLKSNTHKNNWIKGVLNIGLKPKIICIHEVDDGEILNQAEQFWIQYYISIGADLTNSTAGGNGLYGYSHKIESKQKTSLAIKHLWTTSEYRAKQLKSKNGRILSDNHKNNISKNSKCVSGFKGLKHSTVLRKKMGKEIVDQYGTKYISSRDAAERIGVTKSAIQSALKQRNRMKSVKGFILKYARS